MANIIGATHLIKYLRKPRKRIYRCYRQRNDRLTNLGMTYYQYLATPEWKKIRELILTQSPNCLICESKASQVHHTDYQWDTLLGLCLHGLVPLCGTCHHRIEFKGKRKCNIAEANKILLRELEKVKTDQAKKWLARYRVRFVTVLAMRCKEEREQEKENEKERKYQMKRAKRLRFAQQKPFQSPPPRKRK